MILIKHWLMKYLINQINMIVIVIMISKLNLMVVYNNNQKNN